MPPGKKRPKVILMPMDFGTNETRRAYKQAGLIYSYLKGDFLMAEGITFDEFKNIANAIQAQQTFLQLAKENSDANIAKMWGINEYQVKTIRVGLGINKDRTGKIIDVGEIIKWNNTKSKKKKQKNIINEKSGFNITLDGIYPGENLSDRLKSIQSILESVPTNNFRIQINVEEV